MAYKYFNAVNRAETKEKPDNIFFLLKPDTTFTPTRRKKLHFLIIIKNVNVNKISYVGK